MADRSRNAPGRPGNEPHWAPGSKTGVGTALSVESRAWFTLSQGIVDEVFYPDVDMACIRDLGLLVSDGKGFFSEEKTGTVSEATWLAEGVPAFRLINTCNEGRYRIEKTVLADPDRSVILQEIKFVPLKGKRADYAVYALLNPHLGNQGKENTAWVGDYKGHPLLFAQRSDAALALACSVGWDRRSVGFVGASDGWQDIKKHGKMAWAYERAEKGNVALIGQVDLSGGGKFVLALGFGRGEWEAGHRAQASLLQGFEEARRSYLKGWTGWQEPLLLLKPPTKQARNLYRASAAVLRIHESKTFPGAMVASLATPWGAAHGDHDKGYHLVWPRDMVQTVGAMIAIGAHEDAHRILRYLHATQEADGHWTQNMFVAGQPSWTGIQLDETAFVILLVDLARREKAIEKQDLARFWPMVRRAAGYLVRHGPVTPMDRWEEQAGYFASTMAVEIAALLVAGDLAVEEGEKEAASYLRETADAWNAAIDGLIYVTGTDLAREAGVDGHYVRYAGPDQRMAEAPAAGEAELKNHPKGHPKIRLDQLVSPDALLLVRFGLRAADDPRILSTVKVIDHLLKADTPHGPCWHRYNDDGYGEHEDGSPYDGTGIGRAWPLLTGERGHYEVAAGRNPEAGKLVAAMGSFANDSGLLPEQVWDSPDIPERGLFLGRPSGSAMPLVWAHAEYLKLLRSLRDGEVFDMPPQPVQRYLVEQTGSPHVFWRIEQPCRTLEAGKTLRIELHAPAVVRWSSDDWKTHKDAATRDTGLGIHLFDLPTKRLKSGTEIVFTIRWTEDDRWEGKDFRMTVPV